MYTLHTTSCTNQSGARAGRQTWKPHSYNSRSIRLALGRRRQGHRRPAEESGLYLSGHHNAGHPCVCFGRAPHQRPHGHTLTNTNTSKQDTYFSLGGCNVLHYSPLNSITLGLCQFVSVSECWCSERSQQGREE